MARGIIVSNIGELYTVKKINSCIFENSEKFYYAKPRGIFRNKKIIPLVGDIVDFEIIEDNRAVINDIENRQNVLVRPNLANVNQLVIVMAITNPIPDLLLLDKLLVVSESMKLKALICVNKIDLQKDVEMFDYYSKIGYNVLYLSAKESIENFELEKFFKQNVSVLCGLSGVGKSTIINRLMATNEAIVGELSEKIERGKHTTRNVKLFSCYGGYIADTPGFCKLEIQDMIDIKSEDDLKYYYPDFLKFSGYCKFNECNHITEPCCVVKEKVEEGIIDKDRYERYKYLFSKIKSIRKWR